MNIFLRIHHVYAYTTYTHPYRYRMTNKFFDVKRVLISIEFRPFLQTGNLSLRYEHRSSHNKILFGDATSIDRCYFWCLCSYKRLRLRKLIFCSEQIVSIVLNRLFVAIDGSCVSAKYEVTFILMYMLCVYNSRFIQ